MADRPGGTMTRKLYMATDMKALNAFVDVPTNVVNARTLSLSAAKMFKCANDSYDDGDQERSYVFYMRYLQLVTTIKKTTDFKANPKYYTDFLGSKNLATALQRAESLQKSLVDRYDLKQAEELADRMSNASVPKENKDPEGDEDAVVDGGGDGANVAPQLPGGIVAINLYKRLKEGKENVFVIDIRSEKEAQESRVKFPNSMIYVPSELIAPGDTIYKIESKLPEETRAKLGRRREADLVVIMDWDGSVAGLEEQTNPLKTIKDALYKYDASGSLKAEPVVLEGGFEDWFDYYPTYVSGKPSRKSAAPAFSVPDVGLHLDFDYDFEEFSPVSAKTPLPKPLTQPLQQIDFNAIPGLTGREPRPADSPRGAPTFDRTLKPKAGATTGELEIKPPTKPSPLASSGSQDSLSSLQSSGSAEEAAERERELLIKEREMAEKQEELQKLNDTIAAKKREKEELDKNIEAGRLAREAEEAEREKKRKEEEERKVETENLRQERKRKEAEAKRLEAEKEAEIRAREEAARAKLEKERLELERIRSTTEAEKRRVDAEKSAVEAAKRRLEEEARKRPKPKPVDQRSRSRSSSPAVVPKDDPSLQAPRASAKVPPAPKPKPLVDRKAKPNANNNARIVVDWDSRLESLRPVGGGTGSGLTGLRNLGNTCYMNSIIQCLSNTGFLTYYFRNDNFCHDINLTSELGNRGELAVEFALIIRALWCSEFKHISPRTFKQTVGRINSLFVGNDQQDSSELLLFLLDGLHEDLNRVEWKKRPTLPEQNNDDLSDEQAAAMAWQNHKSLNDSIIVHLFQGQLRSSVTCLTCYKKSVTFDPFICLSLPIPSGRSCTLDDCLRLFLKEEKMSGSSQWNCPRCKRPRDAVKKIDVWKLPMVLVIHLKRFSFDGYNHRKIGAGVDFPVSRLALNEHVEGPVYHGAYDLFAVSNHYGTMEGGHYTAYSKNPIYRSWFKFDDHEVSSISSNDVRTSAAYILFYTNKDFAGVMGS